MDSGECGAEQRRQRDTGDGAPSERTLRPRRGSKSSSLLLASSIGVSVSVIDPLESFEALLEEDQLRAYHLYRAVCETHKVTSMFARILRLVPTMW